VKWFLSLTDGAIVPEPDHFTEQLHFLQLGSMGGPLLGEALTVFTPILRSGQMMSGDNRIGEHYISDENVRFF
jgi:hypothetical protein